MARPSNRASGDPCAMTAYFWYWLPVTASPITRMPDKVPALRKIEKLVAEARTELKRVGINTDGKTPGQILDMARAERNKPGARVRWTRPNPVDGE